MHCCGTVFYCPCHNKGVLIYLEEDKVDLTTMSAKICKNIRCCQWENHGIFHFNKDFSLSLADVKFKHDQSYYDRYNWKIANYFANKYDNNLLRIF